VLSSGDFDGYLFALRDLVEVGVAVEDERARDEDVPVGGNCIKTGTTPA